MKIRRAAWISAVAALCVVASIVSASSGTAKRCLLREYLVLAVAPYKMDENYGLGTYALLKGARVYVAAERGLTKEWLTRSLQLDIAKLESDVTSECRPDVRGIQVSVMSSGGGFWVLFAAPDHESAASLLRWTQLKVGAHLPPTSKRSASLR